MSKSITLTWGELDDILVNITSAKDLVEAVHMASESSALTKEATDAIQQVCLATNYRLLNAAEAIEEALHKCQ